jgi:hypothetical protein
MVVSKVVEMHSEGCRWRLYISQVVPVVCVEVVGAVMLNVFVERHVKVHVTLLVIFPVVIVVTVLLLLLLLF